MHHEFPGRMLLLMSLFVMTAAANVSRSIYAEEPAVHAKLPELVRTAKPGDTVDVPAGLYLEDLTLPEGVSLRGAGARKTTIVGSMVISGTAERPVTLSGVSLIHTGGRTTSLVQCKGQNIEIRHCLLISEGGFATVNGTGASSVLVRNNIIVGPIGDYAVFGRNGGHLEIVNNTIIVQGFGVGLMDKTTASIGNCLFCGNAKPAVIRTLTDYDISYSNISLKGGSFYHNHDLIDGNITLRDPYNNPDNPTPRELSNKDNPKYDTLGLSFELHKYTLSRKVDQFKEEQPEFARNLGAPEKVYNNPDGTRNTLGAFGGPLGDW